MQQGKMEVGRMNQIIRELKRQAAGALGRVGIVAGLRGRYRGLGNGLVLLRWIGS